MSRFIKAERTELKARIGLSGPSGSGKTYSALSIAKGLGSNPAVIDTESKSARLYADEFDFMWAPLDPPFSPRRYVEAMHDAVSEGADVIILDSVTHSWSGQGGVLDIVNAAGGRFQDWQKGSPLWQELIDSILRCPVHVIVTVRAKTAYEVSEGGKSVQKLGLAPEARAGLEYEFTIFGEISLAHQLSVSKSRMKELQDAVIMRPGKELGEQIHKWLDAGVPVEQDSWTTQEPGGGGDMAAQPQLPSPTGTTDEWVDRMLETYSEKDLVLVADLVATQTGADFTIRTLDDVRERINPQSARVLIAQKLEEARQVSAGSDANGHGAEIPEGPSSAEPSAAHPGDRVGTAAAPLSEEGMETESSSVSVPTPEDSSAVQESPTGAPPPVQQHADDGVAEADQTADLPSPATGSASAASVEDAAAEAYAAAHPNQLPIDKSPADGDGTSTGPKPQSSSARSSKKGAKK